jgi:hypothetical protein
MASTPHDSGTTFSFAGSNFTVTNIVYNRTETDETTDTIDVSHLGLTTGATVLTQNRPLKGSTGTDTGKEVTIDFIGTNSIAGGTSGTLTITGGLAVSGTATCSSSSVTLALNDVIKGSATFRIA